MSRTVAGARLRVGWSVLRTPALACTLLAAWLAAVEVVARTDTVRAWLPAPSVGSTNRQFEVQLSRLDRFAEREGAIDSLFIGSSVVCRAIDPITVSSAYHQRTEHDLHGFSFGVNGMGAPTSGLMAEILVAQYHPKVLIFGTSPFDYLPSGPGRAAIESSPWLQYRRGHSTLAGWLTTYSLAYRYYLTHRAWRGPRFWSDLQRAQRVEKYISAYGFGFDPRPPWRGRKGSGRRSDHPATFEITRDARDGLARIAQLHQHGLRVIVVEVPVQNQAIDALPGGEQGYRSFVEALERYATEQRIPFWPTRSLNLIPPDGWRNQGHVNVVGARSFSRWLGERLATDDLNPRAADALVVGDR
ncbi:MAG: hypothetical protein HYR72_03360 [Deltaproteobacteria bacterium]|nr:hypothetical protein [Deltaproteobacteria bacterium]MBI3388988.1 hypothetical protein [Deltaproteobacteria bacterium]